MDKEMKVLEALKHKVNSWTIFDLALLKLHVEVNIADS